MVKKKLILVKKKKGGKRGKKRALYSQPAGGIKFSRQPALLPAKMVVPMTYCSFVDITSNVGAFAVYDFAANGLYDPDLTGTGHQPYGFDQWTAFYTKLTVKRSRCVVKAVGITAPLVWGVTFGRGATGSTLNRADYITESSRGTWHVSGGGQNQTYTSISNFDLKITDPEFDPGSFWSTSSANPIFVYHFTIYAQSCDQASSSLLQGMIRIDYQVDLEDPVTIAHS